MYVLLSMEFKPKINDSETNALTTRLVGINWCDLENVKGRINFVFVFVFSRILYLENSK